MTRQQDELLREALERVEWVQQFSNSRAECPWCGNYREDGHRSGCSRQRALAEAATTPLTAERKAAPLSAHVDDSYGGCVICREYVPHTDEEFIQVPFPCPVVRLATTPLDGLDVERLAKALERSEVGCWATGARHPASQDMEQHRRDAEAIAAAYRGQE